VSVSLVTDDIGFVLGYVPCPKGVCVALRQTLDGGTSWATLPPPPFRTAPGYLGQVKLHFATALDGWAFGARLWATDNGARTWHEVDLGGPVLTMASGAGQTYALVERCRPGPSCNGAVELYRTRAGTTAWSRVRGAPAGTDLAQGPFSLVAVGRTVFLAYPSQALFVSPDGLHFSRLPLPCRQQSAAGPGPFLPGGLAAASPSDVAVTCFGQPAMGYQPIEVFISHDGGHHFRILPSPAQVGLGAQVVMTSPTTLLLGTSNSAGVWVLLSASPFRSWSRRFYFNNAGNGLSDLAFVDPAHGALLLGLWDGLGEVYLTGDGGSSWRAVHLGP
jgi:hypothetical protein